LAIPSIVKNISKSFAVSLLQQETRIVKKILAMSVISCDTTGKTHNQHKKQQNLQLPGPS
jgi:hypothetical protein